MKYQIIYADPPWAFNSKKTGGITDEQKREMDEALERIWGK